LDSALRVSFITRSFHHNEVEAHLKAVRNLCHELGRIGIDCSVFSFKVKDSRSMKVRLDDSGKPIKLKECDSNLRLISNEKYLRSNTLGDSLRSLIVDLYCLAKIMNDVSSHRYEVLNVINISKLLIPYMKKKGSILLAHLYGIMDVNTALNIVIDSIDGVVTSSRRIKTYLNKYVPDVPTLRTFLPVDNKLYNLRENYDILSIKRNLLKGSKLKLIYIGNINEIRVPNEFIEDLCFMLNIEHVHVEFNIIAPPTSYNARRAIELRSLGRECNYLKLNIIMTRVDTSSKMLMLLDSHFFVFPANDPQVFKYVTDPPLSIEESLVAGTPVMMGLPLLDAEDVEAAFATTIYKLQSSTFSNNYTDLINKMLNIMANKDRYIELVKASLQLSNLFKPPNIAFNYLKFISEVY